MMPLLSLALEFITIFSLKFKMIKRGNGPALWTMIQMIRNTTVTLTLLATVGVVGTVEGHVTSSLQRNIIYAQQN